MMEYKGYTAKVEFDNDANLFHGQVLHLRDVITFQGQSVDELRREFEASVDDYLDFCVERGEQPEKPFSGRFVVRLDPEVHRKVAIAASRRDQSINTWVSKVIERAVTTALEPAREGVQSSRVASVSQTSSRIVFYVQGHELDRATDEPFQHPAKPFPASGFVTSKVQRQIRPESGPAKLGSLFQSIDQGPCDVA